MMSLIVKNYWILCFTSFFLLWGAFSAYADEPDYIRQSIRARGMGDAFTAVANDEMALYYNPAGLRSVTHNMYYLLGGSLTTNQDTASLGDDTISELADITGRKILIEQDLSALSITTSRWAYSIFQNFVLDATVHNPVVPFFEVKGFAQVGVLAGFALSYLDYKLDIGVGIKAINRSGIRETLHITDEAIIKAIDDNETSDLIDKFSSTNATALDVGGIYNIDSISNFHTKLAAVVKNIGGLDFGNAGNIPTTIDVGISSESELQGFDITLAADYADVTNAKGFAEDTFTLINLKMGAEIAYLKAYNGHHMLSFRVGRNGPYNTAGLTINLPWLIIIPKIDVAVWSQEIGDFAGDKEDKRISAQLSFIY
ncbi:hypothetical protein WDW89_01085 [Deltaproteobacteria bacterium TL4]